jgi:hypothetical protein
MLKGVLLIKLDIALSENNQVTAVGDIQCFSVLTELVNVKMPMCVVVQGTFLQHNFGKY